MHDAPHDPARWRPYLHAAALLGVMCLLGACAGTNCERGVYEGLRRAPNTGERAGNPAPATDAALPDYARYEQERRSLRAPPRPADAAAAAAARPASKPALAP